MTQRIKNILATAMYLTLLAAIWLCGLVLYATFFYGHRMF